ncbi:hypothetical protein C8J35_103506 [Rhizobium sp. PP-F2F-G38]|nr:hypothetical protein C8J35_103506 [Rhizobium sp. PP-F2F-G38]
MSADQLNLFAWEPECSVIVFPFANRIGKIQDTAIKLVKMPTEASARYYRKQVSASLDAQLEKIGVSEMDRAEYVSKFWQSVERAAAILGARSFQA